MSRVGVVGAGYVGLTTAACLAHLGHEVASADIDVEKLARLSRGEIPILESGLAELVRTGLDSGRLSFALGASAAATEREFVFLCVPTPQGEDAAADLSFVAEALREIAPVLAPGTVVVAKSTMPPGSSRFVRRVLDEEGVCATEVGVASNPEFLREGSAVHDFLNPDRIVIGSDEADVAVRVSDLYRKIQAPLLVTDCATAEMIKYASNTFLATKVSFINAIANLCESLDADVRQVTLGMGYDHRIGFRYLAPGPGYGGSCLPKDCAALIRAAEDAGYDFGLLKGVVTVNEQQHRRIVDKVRTLAGPLAGVRVAVWGLTFKAETNDLRDSPALEIVRRILQESAVVVAYDPAAGDQAAEALGEPEIVLLDPVREMVAVGEHRTGLATAEPPGSAFEHESWADRFFVAPSPYEACRGAAVLVVLTEWDEFRRVDFERLARTMRTPAVVDARNLLDPDALRRLGFAYQGVGR